MIILDRFCCSLTNWISIVNAYDKFYWTDDSWAEKNINLYSIRNKQFFFCRAIVAQNDTL